MAYNTIKKVVAKSITTTPYTVHVFREWTAITYFDKLLNRYRYVIETRFYILHEGKQVDLGSGEVHSKGKYTTAEEADVAMIEALERHKRN